MISMILAIVIWTLIRSHLVSEGTWEDGGTKNNRDQKPAIEVSEDALRALRNQPQETDEKK